MVVVIALVVLAAFVLYRLAGTQCGEGASCRHNEIDFNLGPLGHAPGETPSFGG
jgi:hypothetical protein